MIINLSVNKQADIERFIRFMNHPQYPGKRTVILKSYPEIIDALKEGSDENIAIQNIIDNLYIRKEQQITDILNILNNELEKTKKFIESIGEIMEYDISSKKYESILTFLPFSPIKDNVFYFSIYPLIFRKQDGTPLRSVSIACTAIHEISHFIFFDQLKEWEHKTGKTLDYPVEHYFKESLTASIMDQEKFKNFFDYKSLLGSKNYRGNKELHSFFIKTEKTDINIVSFFKEVMFNNGKKYKENLHYLLNIFCQNQSKFIEKWQLWNDWLSNENLQDKIIKEYSKPISL